MSKESSSKTDAMRKQREEQYARRMGRPAAPTKPSPEPAATAEPAAPSKPLRRTGGALAAAKTALSNVGTGGKPRCPTCGKKVPVENGKIGVHKANMKLCPGSRQAVPE